MKGFDTEKNQITRGNKTSLLDHTVDIISVNACQQLLIKMPSKKIKGKKKIRMVT